MRTDFNLNKGSRRARYPFYLVMKGMLVSLLLATGIQLPLSAQSVPYTKPTWLYGAAAGANFNFYRGTTQELNNDLIVPAAFHHGFGLGLFLAPLVEYKQPDSKWGLMLQAGYDGRNGKFEKAITPCNCVTNLSTNLHYLTVEPSLKFAPFNSNFYLFAGPRFAYNISSAFTYQLKANVAFPEQTTVSATKGNFSSMNKFIISMQVGAGYDIPLTSRNKRSQVFLSPFVAFQPYLGQDPRSLETWTVTTLRVGAAIKFGHGKRFGETAPAKVTVAEPTVKFSVVSPENIPTTRRVRETFPLRNYIFFDIGSTAIPSRYVLLTKDQVKEFKEDQLEVLTPKALSGRSAREMVVYYNLLNILGDRMQKNPSAVVRLTGACKDGKSIGLTMADTIKQYLVTVFGIEPSRINTEGRLKPRTPSEKPGATRDLDLLNEGDNRVSIASSSPELLMEFQTGSESMLKPVVFNVIQDAPPESYVKFNVAGQDKALTSWSLEVKDKNGKVQNFGPFTKETESLPGKSILGTEPQGDYQVTMVGNTKTGKTVRQTVPVHMVLWTPSSREQGMRYSVLFEFDESKSIQMYDKYLTEVITPKIPKGGKVIIHGHTDTIGDPEYNKTLSLARANDVLGILKKSLAAEGRTDVTFEIFGYGADELAAPFGNHFPEERFYNRTVIIDVIPKD